jgi:hypothetical protein
MLTGDRHLCRDDLRLESGGELLRLGKTEPEVGQASLLIAFDAGDLDLRRLASLQLRHQFRHQLTLIPVSLRPTVAEQTPQVCMLPTVSGNDYWLSRWVVREPGPVRPLY